MKFLGFPVKFDKSFKAENRSWFEVTAKVEYEEAKEYDGKNGPVLYPLKIEACDPSEDEMVYFS